MGSKKNLHPDTLSLRSVSEMKMKLLQAILRSKWRRFAWQSPEAQGSDLSGNLFLYFFVPFVLIDRAQKLA
jgi:hypothetical protein